MFRPVSLGVPKAALWLEAGTSTRVRTVSLHGFFCSAQPPNLLLSYSLGVADKDGGRKGRFLENLAARAGSIWPVSLTAEDACQTTGHLGGCLKAAQRQGEMMSLRARPVRRHVTAGKYKISKVQVTKHYFYRLSHTLRPQARAAA